MVITEAALYEAFNLEAPAQAGAEAPEATETVAGADGAQDQAVAEPEQMETEPDGTEEPESDADSDGGEEPANGGEEPEGGKELTAQQRRANAARRRQAQQQEATQKAVQTALAAERQRQETELQNVLAQSGLVSTTTGQPITTLEQLREWSQEMANARIEGELKKGKLTREMLDEIVKSHPAVQQAQQVVQQAHVQQQEQQQAAERSRIEDQLAQIGKLNPQIKSLQDILAMDTAPAFRANVAKGMDFLDAYRLANMETMAEEKARRAATAAGNKSRGKEHLVASGNARGSGAASVPPAQMKLYRMMNPNMTEAQIAAHYNNYLKQGG